MTDGPPNPRALPTAAETAQFRREGYLILRGVLSTALVEACKADLSALAVGTLPRRGTNIYYEDGVDPATLSPESRESKVRRFDSFCDDSAALLAAAMAPRLHAALDVLVGQGRSLFQEMALVKPPEIGAEKPWHQDAAYFLATDPALIIGTWTALDRATLENGCMQMAAGSHLRGPVPHVAESLSRCWIPETHRERGNIVPLEMEPGDTVVFHGLLQHFTDVNRSAHRRRALQFHYCQTGAVWSDVAQHARHFQAADGAYAGCVVPSMPPAAMRILRGEAMRPVMPVIDAHH